ncbi:hypothetical protein CVS40_5869 [Lucilia cuprina]|nr:hypothetical protein CVS40_5869 [Lucilia cuprina]
MIIADDVRIQTRNTGVTMAKVCLRCWKNPKLPTTKSNVKKPTCCFKSYGWFIFSRSCPSSGGRLHAVLMSDVKVMCTTLTSSAAHKSQKPLLKSLRNTTPKHLNEENYAQKYTKFIAA